MTTTMTGKTGSRIQTRQPLVALVLFLAASLVQGFQPSSHLAFRQQQQRHLQSKSKSLTSSTTTSSSCNTKSRLRIDTLLWSSSSSSDDATPSDEGANGEGAEPASNQDETSADVEEETKKSLWGRIKAYFQPKDDGLTFRQRMAKMGLAVALSYGWVSNMSYCVGISIAWYIFSSQTGMSPLAPGQWKRFLAVYGGFYLFNNIVRPLRVAASVAVSPKFEQIVAWVQQKLGLKKKGQAVFVTVLVINGLGTTLLSALLIGLAATLAGVPVFPPKA